MVKPRPNPEELLRRVQDEDRKERRGKLKVYLGAAPGVGKTYEMLRDALVERNKGLDVVIGIAESHGRDEISRMIKDFESLPRQVVQYHGKELLEFDIDSALNRNPGLILIDEMAHSNAPGLRHTKRWQDIKELLDRGINVYTTLNVQHIESLNDDVTQIIQVPIKETVPDFMIERADAIELVDLPPEELLKRLRDGKIYIAEQAALAVERYFRLGNLIALRALALRVTADRVGAQVLSYRHDKNITQIWPTKEKILVCIGPGAESLKLIRAAHRMASSLHTDWIAVYVETSRHQASEEQKNNAIQNLRYAQKMGAETRFLSGADIVKEVMNFAREQNVTQIMVWKTIRTRPRDLFFRHLADELVRYSGEIDIYIMTGKRDSSSTTKASSKKSPVSWPRYLIAMSIISLATLINFLLFPYVQPINLFMVYLLSIIIVASSGEQGPSLLASIVSVVVFEFFFIPPFFSFSFSHLEYFFTLAVLVIVSQIVTHLNYIERRQAEAARFSEQQISALYKLSYQLASTRGEDKLLDNGVHFIAQQFDSHVIALMAENGHLIVPERPGSETILSEKEQSIAQWVYDLGQVAGLGTETLPFAEGLYLPLLASQGAIGVLRILPTHSKQLFTPEQMHLLEACANQIALVIEADRAQLQTKKSILTRDKNYMSNVLLQSIAHELRTPLASIMLSASNQIELAKELTPAKIKTLGKQIYFESEQLSRLINNFLQITYLESRRVLLQKQTHSLAEIIQIVLESSCLKLKKRPVNVHIPKDLPKCTFDNTLIQEVLINLLDNVIKLTPPDTAIDISVFKNDDSVMIVLDDNGPGIMPDEINKLFEKFYRGRLITTERGLGLGLAICHRIVKLHGGTIWAENREQGGASFRFTLPITP